ncbi:MAG TPA: transcriptional regulator, partial [Myxococcota bacterium]|nr:transcriptional regulator [Myxococcota bacterium]
VGPLEALFAPADVAAAPAVGLAGPPRPATSQLIRPGACDVPGSGGCGLPGGGAIRENPPARPDRPAP